MGLLYYLSYGTIVVAFAFVTLSLASGLLYVSELIEEHAQIAKKIGQRGILVIITLHLVLWLSEPLPTLQILFSVFCHIVYLQNLSPSWPFISLTSLTFIASCGLVIIDHFLWFYYFSKISHQARHQRLYRDASEIYAPGFSEIASFFGLCVWLTPLFLFLSLSANDNALPTAEPSTPSSTVPPIPQARTSLLRSIFEPFAGMLPKLGTKNRDGLIAPRSPHLASFSQQNLGMNQYSQYSRPQSPLSRSFDSDGNIRLSAPPKRSSVTSLRTPGDESSLRRSHSTAS